jgi:hypothetical protein
MPRCGRCGYCWRVCYNATAKRLNSKAQGRAAHPGSSVSRLLGTPKGCDSCGTASRCRNYVVAALPGCAARPWALEFNAFGVKCIAHRHRCSPGMLPKIAAKASSAACRT